MKSDRFHFTSKCLCIIHVRKSSYMPSFDWIFGYRNRWTYDPSRRSNQKDVDPKSDNNESERRAIQDSIIAEQDKRKTNGKTRPCYSSQELVAMLPEAPKTNKSVDEIVHEGLAIIDLLDQL